MPTATFNNTLSNGDLTDGLNWSTTPVLPDATYDCLIGTPPDTDSWNTGGGALVVKSLDLNGYAILPVQDLQFGDATHACDVTNGHINLNGTVAKITIYGNFNGKSIYMGGFGGENVVELDVKQVNGLGGNVTLSNDQNVAGNFGILDIETDGSSGPDDCILKVEGDLEVTSTGNTFYAISLGNNSNGPPSLVQVGGHILGTGTGNIGISINDAQDFGNMTISAGTYLRGVSTGTSTPGVQIVSAPDLLNSDTIVGDIQGVAGGSGGGNGVSIAGYLNYDGTITGNCLNGHLLDGDSTGISLISCQLVASTGVTLIGQCAGTGYGVWIDDVNLTKATFSSQCSGTIAVDGFFASTLTDCVNNDIITLTITATVSFIGSFINNGTWDNHLGKVTYGTKEGIVNNGIWTEKLNLSDLSNLLHFGPWACSPDHIGPFKCVGTAGKTRVGPYTAPTVGGIVQRIGPWPMSSIGDRCGPYKIDYVIPSP